MSNLHIPIKEFIFDLKHIESQMKASISKTLYKEDKVLLDALRKHSPVDEDPLTKDAMVFKNNWSVKKLINGSKSNKSLAGIVITNSTPLYGVFVAFGARPLKAPWYYPHRDKKTGRMRKGTGKLKMSTGKGEGRIWAGGLAPGHNLTEGGPIEQVFGRESSEINKMLVNVANGCIKAFI